MAALPPDSAPDAAGRPRTAPRHRGWTGAPRYRGWTGLWVTAIAAAGGRNMRLIVQLRWLAVVGQLLAVLFVHFGLEVPLPVAPMLGVVGVLAALNLATPWLMRERDVTNALLFLSLLIDVAALTVQLYLSGGAANPFVSLYLLQVVLGAVLLDAASSWALVALTAAAFLALIFWNRPLALPPSLATTLSGPHLFATWLNFCLAAGLLVQFLTRIQANLRKRDAHLAELRQRAAEEDHIVRMGLLASGAAHELGTPLASIAVALADWKHVPAIAADPGLREEIGEMEAEVARCKAILKGILYASGEAQGEAPARTTLRAFVHAAADGWDAVHPGILRLDDRLGDDVRIVADRTLAQVIANLLDNALEAAATSLLLIAERDADALILTLRDNGTGFPAAMLAAIGKPYQTSKGKRGGGLGLFLAVNVVRKLGGTFAAANRDGGGAVVTLTIPLAALALEARHG